MSLIIKKNTTFKIPKEFIQSNATIETGEITTSGISGGYNGTYFRTTSPSYLGSDGSTSYYNGGGYIFNRVQTLVDYVNNNPVLIIGPNAQVKSRTQVLLIPVSNNWRIVRITGVGTYSILDTNSSTNANNFPLNGWINGAILSPVTSYLVADTSVFSSAFNYWTRYSTGNPSIPYQFSGGANYDLFFDTSWYWQDYNGKYPNINRNSSATNPLILPTNWLGLFYRDGQGTIDYNISSLYFFETLLIRRSAGFWSDDADSVNLNVSATLGGQSSLSYYNGKYWTPYAYARSVSLGIPLTFNLNPFI